MIKRYDVSTDNTVELTQEYYDAVENGSRKTAYKIFMIKEISNLHVIRDAKRIDELYEIICQVKA